MSALLIAETNFVVGRMLEQANEFYFLERLARRGLMTLAVPELSLHEADGTLRRRYHHIRDRITGIEAWLRELRQIGYARPLIQGVTDALNPIRQAAQEHEEQASRSITALAAACVMIPYSPEAMARARLRFLDSRPPFKEPDCELFESILLFLRQHHSEYDHILFLNLDKEDFDFDAVRRELAALHTSLIFSLSDCISQLRRILQAP